MSYEDRTPPNDVDAERAVLGSMLLSKDAVTDVVEVLQPRDYYRPQHETIHNVIIDLFTAGDPVDPITVAEELTRRKELTKVGGAPYLHTCMTAVPVTASVRHWAGIVAEKAALRRVADAGRTMMQAAYNADGPADNILNHAQGLLDDAGSRNPSDDYAPISVLMEPALDHIEGLAGTTGAHGTPTGFYDLDDLTGGLHPGQMVVVAGRPASGKSTLATDFLRAASIRNGMPSVIFSLEMTRQELVTRILSAEAKVPLAKLRNGALDDRDWSLVAGVVDRITAAPLYIDDSPNMTMTEIRAKARRLHHDHPLALIVVDYMQLMSSGQKVENRQVEVSEFSRQMKLLAKELDCPVVALSQLNRGPEQRSTKRPLLSDLRESGAIEQDADVVILVHRDDMYEPESSRPGEADLIVAKHRNGATRDVVVAAQLHYSRFVDIAKGM